MRRNLANTGAETLRAVAFFAAQMFTQQFDNVMLPPDVHVLGYPNEMVDELKARGGSALRRPDCSTPRNLYRSGCV